MIRYLQRQKAKKGFTILELIVVLAILAVLTAIILPQMTTKRSRINAARSAARDFYAAVQSVMNYYAVYDGQVLPNDPGTKKEAEDVVKYYKNLTGNYPIDYSYTGTHKGDLEDPNPTSMYIMVHTKNSHVSEIGIIVRADEGTNNQGGNNGMFQLLKRGKKDDGSDDGSRNTKFGEILKGEINTRVSFNENGYYYAKVVFRYGDTFDATGNPMYLSMQTLKVEYTAYCSRELPDARGKSYDSYIDSYLRFAKDYQLNWNSGEVCGTCAEWYEDTGGNYVCTGIAGTTLA